MLAEIAEKLGIHAPVLISNIAAFLLFFAILYKFAWKNVGAALDQRRAQIQDQFDRIEQGKAEIEVLKAEFKGKLKELEAEKQERFAKIEAAAKEQAKRITGDAEASAARLRADTEAAILREVEKAKQALAAEVAGIARAAAEKILKREIDAASSRKLVDDFMEDLRKVKV